MKVSDARKFILESIGPKVGVAPGDLDAWHNVPFDRLLRFGAHGFLAKFNYSTFRLFRSLLPEFEWDSEKFSGKGFDAENVWNSEKIMRSYLEHLGDRLGIKEGDFPAWYNVTVEELKILGAHSLLRAKRYRVPTLVKAAFPEHNWDLTAFAKSKFFPMAMARRDLMAAAEKHGFKFDNFESWYDLDEAGFQKFGIRFYMSRHYMSRYQLLAAAFPEHTWHPFLFKYMRARDWSQETLETFAKYLERELKIESPEDWYRVTRSDLRSVNQRFHRALFVGGHSELLAFLRKVYPNYQWDVSKMAWSPLGWSHLLGHLEQLFPSSVFRTPEKKLVPTEPTAAWMNRSLIVPQHKLLFYYQGPIAYAEQVAKKSEYLTRVDSPALVEMAQQMTFTLVSVPFWWNRERDSLLAELYLQRKDLFSEGGPLKALESVGSTASLIPSSILFADIDLNAVYMKTWRNDERFEHLFKEKVPEV